MTWRSALQGQPSLTKRRASPERALRALPAALVVLRALLGPLALLMVWGSVPGYLVAFLLCVGLLSDILDGVIARRLGVATTALRRADSVVDTLFFVCLVAAAWLRYPRVLDPWWPAIVAIAVLEVLRNLYDFWKFRREAAYHMWSAKLWGLSMALALMLLFLTGDHYGLLYAVMALGLIAECEGLAASYLLPVWQHDVPTVVHARRLARKFQHAGAAAD